MKVKLIDVMGSDLSVVNAARVSFDKESRTNLDGSLRENDKKLIDYLAKHNHWTPFGHAVISIRVEAPIFVARQLGKSTVGLVWNEVSRRYVDNEPEFYNPEIWRKRADNVKQGSSEEPVEEPLRSQLHMSVTTRKAYKIFINYAEDLYKEFLEQGVCPEQARMILPQSMYTEWIWTGSLAAFARVCNLRLDPHTQKETREIAQKISDICSEKFPVSWEALTNNV